MRRIPLVSALFLLCLTASEAQSPRATVSSGTLEGAYENGVAVFKGVPFAAPPVGELRWRPPQPVNAWTGPRSAKELAPDCPQGKVPLFEAPLRGSQSEDCLYINVWTTKSFKSTSSLPVMVWIHGGGFTNGGISPAVFDGAHYAEKGVILVSLAYRLGRFGFFAFPALSAESKDGLLGNYGYLDQIAALKWVQQNIAQFGGDPKNVTVFGESAGGFSITFLMTSPLAEGLFSKAIIQSGGGRLNLASEFYRGTALPNSVRSAEAGGLAFAKSVGINGADANALRELRALPSERLVASMDGNNVGYGGPMIDGTVCVTNPGVAFLSGAGMHVPLIVGGTSEDLGLPTGDFASKDEFFASFGQQAEAAQKAYDPGGNTELVTMRAEFARDKTMLEPARFLAGVFQSMGVPSYEYRFSYVPKALRAKKTGASHASDNAFVFDSVASRYPGVAAPEDEAMAQTMLDYWAAFAKTGRPEVQGKPEWPIYSPTADTLMNFTNDGPVPEADPWKARLDVTSYFSANRATPAPPQR